MYSPGGVQAGKKRIFYSLFYIFFIGDETVPMKEGLNGVMAFTTNGNNFGDFMANAYG